MKRALLLAVCFAAIGAAAESDKRGRKQAPAADVEMSPEAHAPLFRKNVPQQGTLTDRLTAGLAAIPKEARPLTRRNFIDEEIFAKMARDKVPHAPLSTDLEFIRRAKLDLAGRIPSATEVREFLADASTDKREKLIAKLVGSPRGSTNGRTSSWTCCARTGRWRGASISFTTR